MIKAISICRSLVNLPIKAIVTPSWIDVGFNLKDGNFIVNKYKVKWGVIGKFGVYFKIAVCNVGELNVAA